jgi:3-oxoacyl-[acyl-carrier protein] reductase
MSLEGKVAIVTGGSRGIGAGIAKELGKRGAKVVITYASSSVEADEVVQTIKRTSDAIAVQADCVDRDAPQKIVSETLKAFGNRIDIIINNAGAGDELLMKDITYEHFDKVFYTNVRFPMFLVQSCLPHLQKGGRIVNLSSVVARQGKYDVMVLLARIHA